VIVSQRSGIPKDVESSPNASFGTMQSAFTNKSTLADGGEPSYKHWKRQERHLFARASGQTPSESSGG